MSLGSTPKTDASSKKRAGSREGASDASSGTEKAPSRTVTSATSGPLQLRAAWESSWEKYEKIYDVELGGPMEVARHHGGHQPVHGKTTLYCTVEPRYNDP
jgi:hypothetical protein